jgi:ubiquinone/menaquinone biosynthesis C-methylase UbiE
MANDHPSTAAWHDSAIAQKYVNGEKATRPYAKILVEKSNLADVEDAYVLDLACGTGAVVQEIYDAVPKEKWDGLKVHGGDVSQPMLDYLKTRGEENGWVGLETGVVDGNVCIFLPFTSYIPSSQLSRRTFFFKKRIHKVQAIPFPDSTFTHALCTFGVFMMPKSLSELYRVTKPGGFVGVTSWARFQW